MKYLFEREIQPIPQKKQTKDDSRQDQTQARSLTLSLYSLRSSNLQVFLSVYYSLFSFSCNPKQSLYPKGEEFFFTMEKHQYGFLLIFCVILSLSLVSFVSCIIAETRKAKKEDVRLNGTLCYVPESGAFGFGIAALICLVIAQTIGSLLICTSFCFRDGRNGCCRAKRPRIATTVGVLSWISFGLALTLLSTATSMSRSQNYGKGWLDHECYVVKNGVYSASGVLVLVTTAATLSSSVLTIKKKQIEQDRKVHTQVG